MPVNRRILKVAVAGAPGVGKTALIRRYVFGRFSNGGESTAQSTAYRKRLPAGELIIWEVGTEEKCPEAILRGSVGAALIVDVTDEATLEWAEGALPLVRDVLGDKPVVLVGNKCDLRYAARFWVEELKAVAEKWDAMVYLTSARTGENVSDIFDALVPNGRS